MNKKQLIGIIILFILTAACSQPTRNTNPSWVDKLIQQFESQPVANPPLSIWRYDYNGQTVYFVPAQCCDIFSMLYDASGSLLCAPDGGIAGHGDGKCPDFFDQRSNEQLIWQDTRKP